MRVISKEELKEILEKHKKWLNDEEGGKKADLRKANLSGADLRGTDLRQADLRETDLSGADLQGTDLRYASLLRADLNSSDLRYASLFRADLNSSDLRYASLLGASLRYADLRGSNLNSSALRCANLYCANLYCADLRDADLRDANLYGTDLRCVYRPWLVIAEHIGSRRSETLYFADYDNVRCGCWNNYMGGTLSEFKARVDETYPADDENKEYQRYRFEYLSAIKMFESMREAYLKSAEEKKNNENNIK